MTGVNPGLVAKWKQHGPDGADEGGVVATRQVGPTDASGKQCVADEEIEPLLALSRHFEADATRAVSRRVVRANLEVAEGNGLARRVEAVDRRWSRIDNQPEQPSLLHGVVVDEEVVLVQVNRHPEGGLRRGDSGDMIDVRVRQQDVQDLDGLLRNELEQPVHFVAGIDDDALARARTCDDEAVLVERSHGLRLDYDHAVILAILDDLLFTSKIRSTAGHAAVAIAFARSPEAALEQMRTGRPSLVIFDLNNPRTDPLGILARMKADPALASIPTLGFVSHVDTATIEAARTAGIGEVLARSAFAGNLLSILSKGRSDPSA
jgi:CheY-like chemotaxis protein